MKVAIIVNIDIIKFIIYMNLIKRIESANAYPNAILPDSKNLIKRIESSITLLISGGIGSSVLNLIKRIEKSQIFKNN